eukprot:CAMPEP_0116842592 /NCGR_PEP_ID=MMETSP0418-20121206/11605_1 /TAXON_ID=1158023 /ORGANISM="Astrosyne radiata, Strain 13vi08-1A" /LENGTH=200 /DNA_ID=CAMNT_0004473225 /DNA_START=66 /DNA_END=668 /DNA_ORIENTATION=-
MKSALAIVALVAGAQAFAPSATVGRKTTKVNALDLGEVDTDMVDIETGWTVWDPCGLAEIVPQDFARKAELANGRVAMLAFVGWLWPAWVGTFDSDDVTTTDPIDAFLQADPQWWAQFIVLCGTIEGLKYRADIASERSYAGGDVPFWDYTGKWAKMDAAARKKIRLQELKNGRLAMVGIIGFLAERLFPGAVPAGDFLP